MFAIWGRSWDKDIASLRVFMATLRKKLKRVDSLGLELVFFRDFEDEGLELLVISGNVPDKGVDAFADVRNYYREEKGEHRHRGDPGGDDCEDPFKGGKGALFFDEGKALFKEHHRSVEDICDDERDAERAQKCQSVVESAGKLPPAREQEIDKQNSGAAHDIGERPFCHIFRPFELHFFPLLLPSAFFLIYHIIAQKSIKYFLKFRAPKDNI